MSSEMPGDAIAGQGGPGGPPAKSDAVQPESASTVPAASKEPPGGDVVPQADAVPAGSTVPAGDALPAADGALPAGDALPSPESLPADAVAADAVAEPPPRRRDGKGLRRAGIAALVVVGIGALVAGSLGLLTELTRSATRAEVAAAEQAAIASRWQRLPAGVIFPAAATYQSADGFTGTLSRAGIAPAATCRQALDPAAFAVVRRYGCVTVIRATYVDRSGAMAATVGVAVLSSPGAATSALRALGSMNAAGVRVVTLPGTVASAFGDAQRAVFGVAAANGPYVVLYAVGFTDGRPGSAGRSSQVLRSLGDGLAVKVAPFANKSAAPCQSKDIKC